jgi:hypothetical protein
MDALQRLTQALDHGAVADLLPLAVDAAVCCEAASRALLAANGAESAAALGSYTLAATRLLKLLSSSPDGASALNACAPRLLPAVEALVQAVLHDAVLHGSVSEEEWRKVGGAATGLVQALLDAARAHAGCAAAADCVRLAQRLVEEAASAVAHVHLVAQLSSALTKAAGGEGDAPPALLACADDACAAMARCCADASRRMLAATPASALAGGGAAAAGPTSHQAAASRDAKLCSFFAVQALKLAAKASAGAAAWSPLLDAGVAARRAQAACAEPQAATSLAEAVARLDACLYRTLEAASLDVAAQARLLDALCCAGDGVGAGSCEEALSHAAARCGLVCDALLLRAPQHPPRLRAAAALRMRWAARTACCDCTAVALALPAASQAAAAAAAAPALLRPRLLAALGACLSACAAGADEPAGAPAWAAAEAFLYDAAADAHPLLRATALDAWAALAAASPRPLAARHVTQLLTLLAACLAGAPAAVALDALRCATPRGCPASDAPQPRAAVAARLAAAAARLLHACPDGGSLASGAYAQLLAGPTSDPFGEPPAAALLLCAGFPLARLRDGAAAHAARQLPRAAVAEATAALEAVAPVSGAAMQDASPAAHRLYRCAPATRLWLHFRTDAARLPHAQLPRLPRCAGAAVRSGRRPGR